MTTGQRIRQRREERGIKQSELARQIGVSKQSLYKYEMGIVDNIPLSIIEKMAFALSCSPAYLAGWSEEVTT